MAIQASEYSRSYNSFSGVDIKVTFASKVIGECQAVSYSITREKAPVYTLGSPDPRAFARGKRGIAGTLIFVMFDQHALLEELSGLLFQSDVDDLHPDYDASAASRRELDASLVSTSGRLPSTPLGGGIASAPSLIQQESDLVSFVNDDQVAAMPWYTDQIPGFDITLAAANEHGALAIMKIFGVEILNEGYGISIDDIVSEQQMTYLARTIMPWKWVKPSQDFL
jgi:hypothetical protein